MDGLQAAIASLALVAVVLLLVLAICHRIGPKASAWVTSEREEKIGLSKNRLFHANGYLIHQSGSDILLSSTGSFKRFESIDRDYVVRRGDTITSTTTTGKPGEAIEPLCWTANTITAPELVSATSAAAVAAATKSSGADLPAAVVGPALLLDPMIPPQPLRPAPAPAPSTIERRRSERAMRQMRSCDNVQTTVPTSASNIASTTAIPRPVARRQMSSPAATTQGSRMIINLAHATAEMCSTPRPSSTNPFLNGVIDCIAENQFTNAADADVVDADDDDAVFASASKPSLTSPLNSHPAVCSWLENETIPITAPPSSAPPFTGSCSAHNNPFIPSGTTPSATDSFEKLNSTSPTKRCFDDNFADAVLSGCTDINDQQSISSGQRRTSVSTAPLKFRSRSRSAAEIDETSSGSLTSSFSSSYANVASYARRKMSVTEMFPSQNQPLITRNPFKNSYQYQNGLQQQRINGDGTAVSSLHKTLSETYLEQWTKSVQQQARHYRSASQSQWQFGRALLQRQCSAFSLSGGGRATASGSQSSLASETTCSAPITRATSCESVSSESSVLADDLEQPKPLIAGHLCVGLQTDRLSQTADGIELCVTVMEARQLLAPPHLRRELEAAGGSSASFHTFVRLYLVPDETGASQTRLFRDSQSPSYNETFSFWLQRRQRRRSLWFHLYHSSGGGNGATAGLGVTQSQQQQQPAQHTLLGEAELPLPESMARPMTTWLSLVDSKRQRSRWGDLMFSISYLPTAERLTVVVVKARNLKVRRSGVNDGADKNETDDESDEVQSVFVKVYLLKDQKKVSKKRTSTKRSDHCPIYNESMIFSVPPHMLHCCQIRLTVVHVAAVVDSPSAGEFSAIDAASTASRTICSTIGHVIVGAAAGGKGMRHWNQMMTSLRKPVSMWHPVRQTISTMATTTTTTTMEAPTRMQFNGKIGKR